MQKNSKNYRLLALVIFLIAINVFLVYTDRQSSQKVLTFAMLDIGQGDALFIESPTGTQVLFDAGPARKVLGPLVRLMSPFDKTLDAIVITNPDADHIGGFADVLKNYKVGAVFEPGTLNDSKTFGDLKDEIKKQNIPDIFAKRGMKLRLGGGVTIDILFPDRDVREWSSNDGSIVARLSYADTSIMLTGDATAKTEEIILKENNTSDLASTILKVGHHGSRTSTSLPFAKAVAPVYAVISDGKDNKYDHPHKETLDTLAKIGVQVFRTDLLGSIIMKSDGKTETFSFVK
jgi:competence protein ComEC